MALDIRIRDRDWVTIIDLKGRVVLGDGSQEVTDTVKKLLVEGKCRLLINLAGVDKMDSTGLGTMVGSYASASRQNASLKLLNPTKKIRDLIVITKLVTVFEIFDDEEAAIRSFAEEAQIDRPLAVARA